MFDIFLFDQYNQVIDGYQTVSLNNILLEMMNIYKIQYKT